jgi:hypothetical protein
MPREQMRGDRQRPWTGRISDEVGPVPFAGGTGLLLLRSPELAGELDDLIECVVTPVDPDAVRGDPDCGKWTYDPTVEDVDVVAAYDAELELTDTNGKTQTFPNKPEAREKVTIYQDLNPPA